MFLNQNLQAIREAASPVARTQLEAILAQLESSSTSTHPPTLHETTVGDYTLQFNTLFLHAQSGAEQEAKRCCNQMLRNPGPLSLHIILGLGLGYLPAEVFNHSKGTIFIYEPHPEILRFTLENVQLQEILRSGRVWIATSLSELISHLQRYFMQGTPLDLLLLDGYAKLMKDEIPQLGTYLYEMAEEKAMDYNTFEKSHALWMDRFFENLPQFPYMKPLAKLQNRFQSQPAIIIAPGPSLDKALPVIKALESRCIIIAVGGAHHHLCAAGINPHFGVYIDSVGGKEAIHGLPEAYTQSIHWLLSPFSDPGIWPKEHQSASYLVLSENYPAYASWLEEFDNETTKQQMSGTIGTLPKGIKPARIEGGASVSTSAFQIALLMGCSPIILAGQDLALQGNKIYAGGITVEAESENNHFTVPHSPTLYARLGKRTQVKGQNGELLNSLEDYASFLKHFEEMVQRITLEEPHRQFINISQGGAYIDGFTHLSPEELLTLIPENDLPQASLTLPQKEGFNAQYHLEGLAKLEKGIQSTLPQLQQLCKRLNALLSQTVEQWDEHSHALESEKQACAAQLDKHPLLRHFVARESYLMLRAYRQNPETEADARHNLNTLLTYYQNMRTLMEKTLLPRIALATEQLQQEQQKMISYSSK